MRSIGFPELFVLAGTVVIIVTLFRSMKNGGVVGFAMSGAIVGAVLGFLFRPSVPLVGQLPLDMVLTRGISLNGLDMLLRPTAEQSFNYLIIGAVVGAVIMAWVKGFEPKTSPSFAAILLNTPSSVAPQPSASSSAVNPFCTKCGAALPQDVVFCGLCGARRG
jgi:hypothetical protein